MLENRPFRKPEVKQDGLSSATGNNGIKAVQINAAREMYQMTVRARHEAAGKWGVRRNGGETRQSQPGVVRMTDPEVLVPAKSHAGRCENPQCGHCGAVIIPAPAASFPVKDLPSILIDDWEVFTTRKPILNALEIDHYEKQLNLPLPEMIFGKNEVRIRNSRHNWEIVFNSIDAIDTVLKIGCDPNRLLKVAHSKNWFDYRKKRGNRNIIGSKANDENVEFEKENEKKKEQKKEKKSEILNNTDNLENSLSSDMYDTDVPTENIHEYVTRMIKPYDWTYTPSYRGTLRGSNKQPFVKSDLQIPVKKLKQPDPILFFDDVVLYEDELADNGISILQAKIRVMEKRLLLLCRFFLRIDDVVFKIKDVRVFVEFEDNLVIRDVKEQEDSYQNVYNKVLRLGTAGDPRFYLRDSNWVSAHLPVTFHESEAVQLQ